MECKGRAMCAPARFAASQVSKLQEVGWRSGELTMTSLSSLCTLSSSLSKRSTKLHTPIQELRYQHSGKQHTQQALSFLESQRCQSLGEDAASSLLDHK